eukprot:TRINITY_DN6968_c0_g1_i1.p2 TRINITY_DN6968_c0_g1~~TRINITY_DN6968_c0_g1_i1.p2  ORF type:complete len:55 (-),score=9.14 TRINITY_DN6968_c0_g1_i1:363-527(-)
MQIYTSITPQNPFMTYPQFQRRRENNLFQAGGFSHNIIVLFSKRCEEPSANAGR